MAARRLTLREIRETWPPTVDVGDGARALGFARSTSYEAIRNGTFPVKTITVGRGIRVLTADLIRVLESGDGHEPAG